MIFNIKYHISCIRVFTHALENDGRIMPISTAGSGRIVIVIKQKKRSMNGPGYEEASSARGHSHCRRDDALPID
jgi:hypothetical protein